MGGVRRFDRNFGQWTESGALTATQRANRVWKELLESYEVPAMDSSFKEFLEAYVTERKKQIRDNPEDD